MDAPPPERPLNDLLRKRWAKGEMTSRSIVEVANAAAKQGAGNVGSMGSDNLRNAHRRQGYANVSVIGSGVGTRASNVNVIT